MRPGLLMAVLALCAFVVGCSADVDGSATATQASAESTFDPCTIPDAAIAAAGLDPDSKDSMAEGGFVTPGWIICGWNGPAANSWYSYSVVFSSVYTIEDVRSDARYSEMTNISVAGREALRYRHGIVDLSDSCDIAFTTEMGLVKLSTLRNSSSDLISDMCAINMQHTEKLSSSFPPSR